MHVFFDGGAVYGGFLEKFIFDNKDNQEFQNYFNMDNVYIIEDKFNKELKRERKNIGENIDPNNYNILDQLAKNK